MLESIVAFAFAANVVQLVELTAKISIQALKFINSSSDSLPENANISMLAKEGQILSKRLSTLAATAMPLTAEESAVHYAAEVCSDRATTLLKTLEKLQVNARSNGTSSKVKKARAAFLSVVKQKDIVAAKESLSSAQDQLSIALLAFVKQTDTAGFGELRDCLDRYRIENLESILAYKDDILKAIDLDHDQIRSLGLELQTRHNQQDATERKILEDVREGRKDNAESVTALRLKLDEISNSSSFKLQQDEELCRGNAILDSLKFPDMDLRQQMVPDAAEKTLRWIFREDSRTASECNNTVVEDGIQSSFQLANWLAKGSGIFWVSGKAGAGKSTLMKYVQQSQQTIELLIEWASDRPLFVAQHYFWYAGSPLQKSHEGLLRSLLYQILERNCLYAKVACPRYWNKPEYIPRQSWSRTELIQAFKNIGRLQIKVCCFVDGLDEYYPQTDHKGLVNDILKLAESPNFKFCVSSRPWQVFYDAFKSNILLNLEDVNREDIKQFITAKLEENVRDEHAWQDRGWQLIKNITERSSGVFLWVHLVVRIASDRLKIGQDINTILARINAFPRELEDYLRDLVYKRISPTWRDGSDTAQSLKIAILLHERSGKIQKQHSPLIYWWFVAQGCLEDPNMGIAHPVKHLSSSNLTEMYLLTRNFLKSSCQDLLEITSSNARTHHHDKEGIWLIRSNVTFAHRTVFDFLTTDEMQSLINENIPNQLKARSYLTYADIAAAKLIPPYSLWPSLESLKSDTSFLTTALKSIYDKNFDIARRKPIVEQCEIIVTEYLIEGKTVPRWVSSSEKLLDYSFISNTLYAYFRKKLSIGQDLASYVLDMALGGGTSIPWGATVQTFEINLDLISFLLNSGQDPNCVQRSEPKARDKTTWTLFLGRCMRQAWEFVSSETPGQNPLLSSGIFQGPFMLSPSRGEHIWKILKLLVEKGADLEVNFCLLGDACSDGWSCGTGGQDMSYLSQLHNCQSAKCLEILQALASKANYAELRSLVKSKGIIREISFEVKIEVFYQPLLYKREWGGYDSDVEDYWHNTGPSSTTSYILRLEH